MFEQRLEVEEVKRDDRGVVVWVKLKFTDEDTRSYIGTFIRDGNKVKRMRYPGDPFIPDAGFAMMLRRAYAIFFQKGRSPKSP